MVSRHERRGDEPARDSDDTLDLRNGSDLLVRTPIVTRGQEGIHLVPLSTRRVPLDSRSNSPDLRLLRGDPARRIQELSPSPLETGQFSDSVYMDRHPRLPFEYVTTRGTTEAQETTDDAKTLADAETRLALLTSNHADDVEYSQPAEAVTIDLGSILFSPVVVVLFPGRIRFPARTASCRDSTPYDSR